MKRALPVGLLVTAVLVALGLPFLHASVRLPGRPGAAALGHRRTRSATTCARDFSANAASTITVVARATSRPAPSAIGGYAAALSRVAGVTSVSSAAGTYADGARVAAGRTGDAGRRRDLPRRAHRRRRRSRRRPRQLLTELEARAGAVAGRTSAGRPRSTATASPRSGSALPWALVLIALATFVVLFLFTGSVVLPLKALVLNTLSLSATFGAMVWVFQEGHFGSLFNDLTTTGYLVPTMPPLMFCLAFGLSMDYEVFLLSRIREAWLESGRTAADNTRAVALGLGRTGRIVTAAALLMAIVFAAMAGSKVSFMMLFGTGLTLAVLMDATVVRGILVPAVHAPGRPVELVGAAPAGPAARQDRPARGPVRARIDPRSEPVTV